MIMFQLNKKICFYRPGRGPTESKKSDDIINKVAREQNKPDTGTIKSEKSLKK